MPTQTAWEVESESPSVSSPQSSGWEVESETPQQRLPVGAEKTGLPPAPGVHIPAGLAPERPVKPDTSMGGTHRPAPQAEVTTPLAAAKYFGQGALDVAKQPAPILPMAQDVGLLPKEPNSVASEIGTSVAKATGGLMSPESIALMTGAELAGTGLEVAANSAKIVKALENVPHPEVVLKAVAMAAKNAIPVAFIGNQLKASYDSAKQGEVGDAVVNGLFAVAGLLGVKGSVEGTKAQFPPEVTPEAQAAAAKIGGIATPAVTPEQAQAAVTQLQAGGQNLAAQAWKNLDRSQPIPLSVGGQELFLKPPVMVKGRAYHEIVDSTGKTVIGGTPEIVKGWLNQNQATVPANLAVSGELGTTLPTKGPEVTVSQRVPSIEQAVTTENQPLEAYELMDGTLQVTKTAKGSTSYVKTLLDGTVLKEKTVPNSIFTRTVAGAIPVQAQKSVNGQPESNQEWIPESETPAVTASIPASHTSTGLKGSDSNGIVQSADLKGTSNGTAGNAEGLSDLTDSKAFHEHGLGFLDAPSQGIVLHRVVAALHDPEIRRRVIETVPVNVVDDLIGLDPSSEFALHDKGVLIKPLTANLEGTVSLRSDIARSLAVAVARSTAEVSHGIDLTGTSQEDSSAVRTGDIAHNAILKESAVNEQQKPQTTPPLPLRERSVIQRNQSAVAETAGAPEKTVQEDVTRAKTLKKEVAATLAEGSTRTNPDGSVQELKEVDISKITPAKPTEARPQGNTMFPDVVQKYVDNPTPVAPELRPEGDGTFETWDGHHRIAAAKERGESKILAWVPKEKEVAQPQSPQPVRVEGGSSKVPALPGGVDSGVSKPAGSEKSALPSVPEANGDQAGVGKGVAATQEAKPVTPDRRRIIRRGMHDPVRIEFADRLDAFAFDAAAKSSFSRTAGQNPRGQQIESLIQESKRLAEKQGIDENRARGIILDYHAYVKGLSKEQPPHSEEALKITPQSLSEFAKQEIGAKAPAKSVNGLSGKGGFEGTLYRGTEAGTVGRELRESPLGELGRGAYVTPHRWLAATYGGGPTANVKAGTREVHQVDLVKNLDPKEVAYLDGGSDGQTDAVLTTGDGKELWRGRLSGKKDDRERSNQMNLAARKAGAKIIIGGKDSVALNQVVVLDKSAVKTPKKLSAEEALRKEPKLANEKVAGLQYGPHSHVLVAWDSKGDDILREHVMPSGLDDYIGADVAKELLADPTNKGEDVFGDGYHILKGDDLTKPRLKLVAKSVNGLPETSSKDAFRMSEKQLQDLAAKGDKGAQTEIDRRLIKRGKPAQYAKAETKPAQAETKAPEGETKATPAVQKVTVGKITADVLRKGADSLQNQIDAKRNSGIFQQNPTRRRNEMAEGITKDADRLERIQKGLRTLADLHEAGNVPAIISGVKARSVFESLLPSYHEHGPERGTRREARFPSAYVSSYPAKEIIEKIQGTKGNAEGKFIVLKAQRDGARITEKEIPFVEAAIDTAEKKGFNGKSLRESIATAKRLYNIGINEQNFKQAVDAVEALGVKKREPTTEEKISKAERELAIGSKIEGFFPTPKPLAKEMVQKADIRQGMTVLEPSAGNGNIADAIREEGTEPDVIEPYSSLRSILQAKKHNLIGSDFLDEKGGYDRIVMNPPFERRQDVDHVRNAYELLKPGGRIVAIMSEGTFFGSDKKAAGFREWLDEHNGTEEKLPEGSFTGKDAMRQTGVAARMVVIDKPAEKVVEPKPAEVAPEAKTEPKPAKPAKPKESKEKEPPPIEAKASRVEFGKEKTELGKKTFTAYGLTEEGQPTGERVDIKQSRTSGDWDIERSYYETPPGEQNKYGHKKTQSLGTGYTKADARQVAEAFLKGEPSPFAEAQVGLPMSEYKPGSAKIEDPGESRFGFNGPIAYKDDTWHTNGHVLVLGPPPANWKSRGMGPDAPGPDIGKIMPAKRGDTVEPIGFYKSGSAEYVMFSNGGAMQSKYFDYINKTQKPDSWSAIPPEVKVNGRFKVVQEAYQAHKGDKLVALAMPIRNDAAPERLKGKIRERKNDEEPARESRMPEQDTLFSRIVPGFYSQLERTVTAKMPNKAPASQVLNIVKSPQNGVKEDEIKWSGLDDFLKEKGGQPVTKQEVLEFVWANETKITEVQKGEPDTKAIDSRILELATDRSAQGLKTAKNPKDQAELDRLTEEWEQKNSEVGPAKYGQYVTPGGTNYRELLFTLPIDQNSAHAAKSARVKELTARRDDLQAQLYAYPAVERSPDARVEQLHREKAYAEKDELKRQLENTNRQIDMVMRQNPEKQAGYRSSHWDEPNVLAHIRIDDRTGTEGQKILHLSEIQSDWHQEGKRKGYRTEESPQMTKLKQERLAAISAMERLPEDATPERRGEVMRAVTDLNAQIVQAGGSIQDRDNVRHGVPPAPFAKSWQELSFKRVLRYGAEHGYDAITWDTGETQADRFDLSKQLDSVRWEPYDEDADQQGGTLKAYDLQGHKVIEEETTVDKLPDYIGKEAAQKLVNEKPDSDGALTLNKAGLKVGGEGMKGFYDKILPDFANRYGKKWGSKVGTSELSYTTHKNFVYEGDNHGLAEVEDLHRQSNAVGNNQVSPITGERLMFPFTRVTVSNQLKALIGKMRAGTPFKKAMAETVQDHGDNLSDLFGGKITEEKGTERIKVHSMPITPQMRDSVMQGQPLFMRGQESEATGPIRTAFRNGILWVNSAGMKQLAQVFGSDAANGMYIPSGKASGLLSKVPPELRPGIQAALKAGPSITVVRMNPGESISQSKAKARHELFHATETWGGEGRANDLMEHPLAQRATAILAGGGYDASNQALMFSEIGAHLASGPIGWEAMGLDQDEAEELFKRYLELLDDKTVESLNRIAPQLKRELHAERAIRAEQADVGQQGGAEPDEVEGGAEEEPEGVSRDVSENVPGGGTRPQGSGKVKESRLAKGVEEKAIRNGLTEGFAGRPEYQTVNIAEQAKLAASLIESDPSHAIEIAMGRELPPHGLLPESVFVAVENYATENKDVNLLRDLATSSTLSLEATGMGQRIRMLGERNPNSAVHAMQEVSDAREAAAKKKYGPKAKEKIKAEIKVSIKKANPKKHDWTAFIASIKCD